MVESGLNVQFGNRTAHWVSERFFLGLWGTGHNEGLSFNWCVGDLPCFELAATRPCHWPSPPRKNVGDKVPDERLTAFFKRHVRTQIMRVAKQREDLLVPVTHPQELFDERLGHVVGC